MVVDDASAQEPADGSIPLDEISVENAGGRNGSGNANSAPTGIGRLPATVRETPRVVNVVPQQQLQQQGVTSIEQALRNVPGITLSTGEGNGGANGDQFRIRGFQSKGDIYIDGLRDFGAYVRDSFDTESIEVFKGPNGENFGVGTTGGLINQTSKKAHLGDSLAIDGSLGTGPQRRATIDYNKQISPTTAIRLNGVVHDQDVADRDHVKADRQGFAAALGFGLGTDTVWSLNYMYQHGDRKPDYGVPFIANRAGRWRPATELGLSRSTSYIRDTDKDVSNAHVVTSQFSKEVNDWLTISNDSRVGFYDRDFSSTPPGCSNDASSADGIQYDGSCSDIFLSGGNPAVTYGAGGGLSYKQKSWGIENVTTAKAEFETGGLRHRALAGVNVYYQDDERKPASYGATRGTQTIRDPFYDTPNAIRTRVAGNDRDASASDIALFANDRVWFTDQISAMGSLRWDNFKSKFRSFTPIAADTTAPFEDVEISGRQSDSKLSRSIALLFEPRANQTYYVSYARAYTPIGTNVATQAANATSEVPGGASGDLKLDPEKADLYEFGGKIDLLNGRLGLSGSVFQINKSNTYDVDPETGDLVGGASDANQKRRVRGVEVGATGEVAEGLSLQFGYAYLDSKITGELPGTAATASVKGNDVPFVSKHNATLWATYEISRHLAEQIPGKVLVGGGVQYASAYWADAANTARVPHTFSLDGLISYEYQGVRVALNGYNLTNELNYTSAFNTGRVVPSSGRTALVTVGYRW
ncbi:MAG: TonB-dependent receptor [Hansschlegelia sp.]